MRCHRPGAPGSYRVLPPHMSLSLTFVFVACPPLPDYPPPSGPGEARYLGPKIIAATTETAPPERSGSKRVCGPFVPITAGVYASRSLLRDCSSSEARTGRTHRSLVLDMCDPCVCCCAHMGHGTASRELGMLAWVLLCLVCL